MPPDSLRVLQWNAGCLRARNTELLHFISFYSLNLICNLNSFSSFRIPGFSALRSDWAHSRSDLVLLMPCTIAAASTFLSSKVLSFCALSTSSLSSLDTNSDYVQVNTSLNNLPRSHSFLVHSPTHASFYFLGRLFLLSFPHHLGICLSLLWSPLSLTLTLSHLTIWCSGQTTVRFPFDVPANCSLSVAPRPLFPCQQAQYTQVFLLKSALFCKLFAGLGTTNKSAIRWPSSQHNS